MKLPFILARRFVAAETLEKTLPVALRLKEQGMHTTLDLLGEYVSERSLATAARDSYLGLIDQVAGSDNGIDRNISIKLSMLGQKIDESFCLDNLHQVLSAAKEHDFFIRLDMEGSDITESTLSILERVHPMYPDNVGIVLQAYLKRTVEDIARMCEQNVRVRLCKGAYREPERVAHQSMDVIRERFIEYMETLVTKGRYPGIATHDDILIDYTKQFVERQAIGHDRFEFQMLYGIRSETQQELVSHGYNMRVYVPYGSMWFPYYTRRLRERKENVWFILKNLFRS